MKNNRVLNVKLKLLRMLQDFAETALKLIVKSAEKVIVAKINLTEISAKLASKELLKNNTFSLNKESTSQTRTLYTPSTKNITDSSASSSNMRNMMTSSNFPKKKTPRDQINICRTCASRKNMPKAEKLWIREGMCDFCLNKTHVCQALDYMVIDATKVH